MMLLLPLALFFLVTDMQLTSQAFEQGKPIPITYTCQGKNISPPLSITGVPKEAKSLALIMDDPDAPGGTLVHCVVWNISATETQWEEGKKFSAKGMNHVGKEGYFGPCPPQGAPHHYHFKLYALDTDLTLSNGSTKEHLLKAMEGHIISQTELIGTYQKS